MKVRLIIHPDDIEDFVVEVQKKEEQGEKQAQFEFDLGIMKQLEEGQLGDGQNGGFMGALAGVASVFLPWLVKEFAKGAVKGVAGKIGDKIRGKGIDPKYLEYGKFGSYLPVSVTLTEGQKEKMMEAYSNDEDVNIRVGEEELNGNDDIILVTKTQLFAIQKAKSEGKGKDIKFSRTQLKANGKKWEHQGGFLFPVLAPLIGLIAKGVAKRRAKKQQQIMEAAKNIAGDGIKLQGEGGLIMPDKAMLQFIDSLPKEKRDKLYDIMNDNSNPRETFPPLVLNQGLKKN